MQSLGPPWRGTPEWYGNPGARRGQGNDGMATLRYPFDKRRNWSHPATGRTRLSAILRPHSLTMRHVGRPVSQEFGELLGLYPYLRNGGRLDQSSIADWPNRE
jgi:hypothetical protein